MRLIKEAITELERNPYVIRSGSDRITYSREFKHHYINMTVSCEALFYIVQNAATVLRT